MHTVSRTSAVKIIELDDVVEEASAFASVTSIFTVMEKRLTDIRLVHEVFPLRQQPKVASGWMLARKILMIFDAKLADVKD